jgi:hypothetical protein
MEINFGAIPLRMKNELPGFEARAQSEIQTYSPASAIMILACLDRSRLSVVQEDKSSRAHV